MVGTPYVELIAVMAKYSPFAEKAGMQKVAEQKSVESISEVSNVLLELGFDRQLIGSTYYVRGKVDSLTTAQISLLKEAFIKNKHPRFQKEFTGSRHQPFGKTIEYTKNVQTADNIKISKLIKILAMVSQTKVYLFWSSASQNSPDQRATNGV